MPLPLVIPFAAAALCAIVAVLGLKHATRSAQNWTFVLGMLALAAEFLFAGLSLRAPTFGRVESWQQWRLVALSVTPGVWLLFSLTFARGNAGQFVRRWRPAWLIALLAPIGLAAGFHNELFGAIQPDTGHPWSLRLGWPGMTIYTIVLVGSVLILMNLERTFRASLGTIRWRIKFMLLGVGVIFVVRIYTSSQAVLYRAVDPAVEGINAIAALIAAVVLIRHFFRTSRFESDVYPSQAVLEGSLIVTIAGVYLLIVGVFARVIAQLGGGEAFAVTAFLLLVSLVALAAILQSDRVRLYVRQFVSRHFERPIYDYRTIWRKFSEGTASCVEQTELSRALVTITADVFQALSVSLWINDDQQHTLTLGASTSHAGAKAAECTPTEAEVEAVTRHLQAHPEPSDIELVDEPWAIALRRWHPKEFPNGGNRVCAPLVRQGTLVGILMVGDRVKGIAFPNQDLDMLKCVAEHATASLLNVQLGGRLTQARQLEAFQTMAAFFVHDLKNAASTLNLMLKNLPVHFNDPAFREDALRGIAKTVEHINRLIGRLGLLRHEMTIRRTPTDLNEIVQGVLRGVEKAINAKVTAETAELSLVGLDREQIQKVITNLLLNAAEAAPANGEIRVSTAQSAGWTVLTVSDNGCGMSREFIQKSLFRPFQTTKKTGLGIGMFQSKMIVEAHGGRMTVTSTPGSGSTFQVFLPAGNATEVARDSSG